MSSNPSSSYTSTLQPLFTIRSSINNFITSIKSKFDSSKSTDSIPRSISTSSPSSPSLSSLSNLQNNRKYSLLTFFPKFLFEQLSIFSNLYFLLLAISQFFPSLKVGFILSYLVPVIVILSFALINEVSDEYQRYVKDKEANSKTFERYKKPPFNSSSFNKSEINNSFIKERIKYSEVRVGDILYIGKGESLPADCLLLCTLDPKEDGVYIKTDELDGETDWKFRSPPSALVKLKKEVINEDSLASNLAQLECSLIKKIMESDFRFCYEAPSKEIYSFKGIISTQFSQNENNDKNNTNEEKLSVSSTLWANTSLASTSGVAIVLYTGKDTRMARNTRPSLTKFGQTEKELSSLVLLMLFGMSFFSITLLGGRSGSLVIRVLQYVVLFSHMIPMSMRLNIDIAKRIQSIIVKRDPELSGVVVRTSTIPEELGRVGYVFSDKTGTLTENVMKFRKVVTAPNKSYSAEDLLLMRKSFKAEFSEGELNLEKFLEGLMEEKNDLMRALFSIITCHNILIKKSSFISSSPDEISLVEFVSSIGLKLISRTNTEMKVSIFGKEVSFSIDYILPFDSSYKRMGILLSPLSQTSSSTTSSENNNGKKKSFLVVKGADSSMGRLLKENEWFNEEVDALSRDGLRTLVYGSKLLDPSELSEESFEEVYKKNEEGLVFSGVTGVEDKLQENVPVVIETLRAAGVKVWMLTGDKVETATCVARSTGLISYMTSPLEITSSDLLPDSPSSLSHSSHSSSNSKNSTFSGVSSSGAVSENRGSLSSNQVEIRRKALAVLSKIQPEGTVVIEGEALSLLTTLFKRELLSRLSESKVVVCCRCTPEQKADIVHSMKELKNEGTLAIGDGGNDVSMIREASVGVGIVGKEGNGAALSADYAVSRFADLQKLMLWHGRNSYINIATVGKEVVLRGFLLSFIQYLYSMVFFHIPSSVFIDFHMMCYSSVYTALNMACLYYDRDIRYRVILLYPELYREMLKGRLLSVSNQLIGFVKIIYQGSVIFFLSCVVFGEFSVRLSTLAFTSSLFVVWISLYDKVHRKNKLTYIFAGSSVALYFLSMMVVPKYFMLKYVWSWSFWFEVCSVTTVAVVPVKIVNKIYEKIHPPLSAKFRFT